MRFERKDTEGQYKSRLIANFGHFLLNEVVLCLLNCFEENHFKKRKMGLIIDAFLFSKLKFLSFFLRAFHKSNYSKSSKA